MNDDLTLELWTPDGGERYADISDEVEGLDYSSITGLGYATCSFTVKRSPRHFYDDLKVTNVITLRNSAGIVWKGEIAAPGIDVRDDVSMPIQCDGTGYRLAARRTTATFGNGIKGSGWIQTNIIGDDDLALPVGRIDDDDYAFPYGIDIGAGTTGDYFAEVLNKINKANGWFYGCWYDGFYFHPYPSTAKYTADVEEEGAEVSLAYSLEDIVNYLRVSYTDDGSAYSYFNWPTAGPDEDSKVLYRRRDGTLAVQGQASLAQAQAQATVYLDEHKRMRPKTSFALSTIRDAVTGTKVDPKEVKAGEVIHLDNLYPLETTINAAQMINELSTFEIVQAQYSTATGKVTVSPGAMGLMMEKMLARIEARTPPS